MAEFKKKRPTSSRRPVDDEGGDQVAVETAEAPSEGRRERQERQQERPERSESEQGSSEDGPQLNLKDLKNLKISDLNKMARDFGIEGASNLRKQELIFS